MKKKKYYLHLLTRSKILQRQPCSQKSQILQASIKEAIYAELFSFCDDAIFISVMNLKKVNIRKG